ncbi:filamentous hemagglutinin N-terminal domain-containing protein [Microvirga sp. HBU67558]|uniref:filamentous hemagglutinin N-terminal domain-containing protein n=1 Tax=Microvirga TaxID=186650 RepID=UPI001B36174C|nr:MULTISPECIES: filamentous hemagglutinin N-terminal domain-containing protein [unclassified Microvirga]MBQ0824183.1 filamentous hemagglutinin N-terminal domain-containing protein [Microvirga sp. HBU67558]
MKLRRSLFALVGLYGASQAWAQAVPDGATRTSATTADTGRVTVNIAPANSSGISHNTYKDFSAPKPGLGLNNRGVDASTIVNEVTSSRRSVLHGPVEVLGSRAHVVIANPNGITVDGGSFINTGGVALSAGPIRFVDAGAGRVNTVLETGKGDITITGGGLSGAMTTLQLIAGRLKIDGPVKNTSVSPSADIALVAGRSEITLDSTVSPLSTLRPLATRRDLDDAANAILIDITPSGSLSASRVNISVNSRGAGVSYAGRGHATIGDFTISSNGKITTKGATIKAEKSLKLAGQGIEVLNDPKRQSTLSSVFKSVTLLANAGDITLLGAVTGSERSDEDPDALGGVTLKAKGNIKLITEDAKRLAVAFASKDDLYVEAGGNLDNNTGRILSNANTVLRIGGTLFNRMATIGAGGETNYVTYKRSPGFFGRLFGRKQRVQTHVVDWGVPRVPGQLAFIAGETLDVKAGHVFNFGELDALDGSLTIDTGTLINTGVYTGLLEFTKTCDWRCSSHGTSTITPSGGKINAAGSAEIKASQRIDNGGDIVAYGNLSVIAPKVAARATFIPDFVNRPAGLYNFFSGTEALVSLSPIGGSFLAPVGRVTISSNSPVLSYGGTINGHVATKIQTGIEERKATQAEFPRGLNHIGLLRLWLD